MRILAALSLAIALVACGESVPEASAEKAPEAGHEAEKPVEAAPAAAPEAGTAAVAGKRVFFVEPVDGAVVKSPVKVVFGVEGMGIAPAGEMKDGHGHHHLIVNGAGIDAGAAVPADEKHIHFGKGQTETTIELPPGEHTLTMQFADGGHISYGPEMATSVKIKVE